MKQRAFKQIDVFTGTPYYGKPRNSDLIVQECKVGLVNIRRQPGSADSADRLAAVTR